MTPPPDLAVIDVCIVKPRPRGVARRTRDVLCPPSLGDTLMAYHRVGG